MKRCKYCGELVDDAARKCTSCSGNQFINICVNCGTEFENGMHCPRCGVKVGQVEKICPQCGNHYFTNACGSCGYTGMNRNFGPQTVYVNNNYNTYNNKTVNNSSTQNNSYGYGKPKNKYIALLLCFFTGVVGGHKFYEGKMGMGLLYMCTGGLFVIGAILDFVRLLARPTTYYV